MKPATYIPVYEDLIGLRSDTRLILKGTYNRFGIGAVAFGKEGRQVNQGPMVPGPWAYAFGLCTVIDNRPDLRAAERARDVPVCYGDLLLIDGVTYEVARAPNQNINLIPVQS